MSDIIQVIQTIIFLVMVGVIVGFLLIGILRDVGCSLDLAGVLGIMLTIGIGFVLYAALRQYHSGLWMTCLVFAAMCSGLLIYRISEMRARHHK